MQIHGKMYTHCRFKLKETLTNCVTCIADYNPDPGDGNGRAQGDGDRIIFVDTQVVACPVVRVS